MDKAMSVQNNVKLDEEFLAGWNEQSVDRSMGIFSEDAVLNDVGMPEPMRDKKAMQQYIQSWFTAFPDIHAVSKNRVVTEDQLAGEVEYTGTNTGPLQMRPGM